MLTKSRGHDERNVQSWRVRRTIGTREARVGSVIRKSRIKEISGLLRECSVIFPKVRTARERSAPDMDSANRVQADKHRVKGDVCAVVSSYIYKVFFSHSSIPGITGLLPLVIPHLLRSQTTVASFLPSLPTSHPHH